ncbi:auxin-responsive family protein [Actinidia rufa]|uniref:Auxin-responsive family protein n=1 Tax=Actinidia rufa TaxID=165716 RepID=A0A7J0FX67_9ERIC|nr:auxin-responsive family protein [Actinidia rufa]
MFRPVLFCSILISLFLFSSAQSCNKYAFASNKVFSSCNDLPYLNSFLHWNYDTSSGTAQIAYRHTGITSSRWVAWAINPDSKGMVGSQALVAFQKSDGSMSVYTSPMNSYQTQLQKGDLSFAVSDLTATYSNNEIVIFATLKLPSNTTTVNQVWQDGPLSNDSPRSHDVSGANVQSMATLNLHSGQSGTTGTANSKIKKKNIHGVLNAISWGIMMPVGILIARYVKVFEFADPAWFYLHATCQTSAYIIGVAGWATGLQLGKDSPGIQYTAHRTIGILIFSLATLQVFALLLRPKKGTQIQTLLEHLPPRDWIHSPRPWHHQHIQGIRHLEPLGRQMGKGIHCHHWGIGRRCHNIRSLYVDHCSEKEEVRRR